METFLSIHQDDIMGTPSAFDRMIFKGHLAALFPHGAFARFLARQGVLLKDFGRMWSKPPEPSNPMRRL